MRFTAGYQWLRRHVIITFGLMCVAFATTGIASYRLAQSLLANARFLLEHGWIAIMEGALLQLLQLSALTAVAVAAYLVFKLCESVLIDWLARRSVPQPQPEPEPEPKD